MSRATWHNDLHTKGYMHFYAQSSQFHRCRAWVNSGNKHSEWQTDWCIKMRQQLFTQRFAKAVECGSWSLKKNYKSWFNKWSLCAVSCNFSSFNFSQLCVNKYCLFSNMLNAFHYFIFMDQREREKYTYWNHSIKMIRFQICSLNWLLPYAFLHSAINKAFFASLTIFIKIFFYFSSRSNRLPH